MCDRVNECEFVKELREEIARLRARIGEVEKLGKNSGNRSLPSSSDKSKKFYPPREKSNKRQGGQKGHFKALYDNPDEVVELYPKDCVYCGSDHFIKKEAVLEQRQVIDIPTIQPYITEYQQKAGICTKCRQRNVGEFPKDISPSIQIGEHSKAVIGYLNVQHHIGYGRLLQIFYDIFNQGL